MSDQYASDQDVSDRNASDGNASDGNPPDRQPRDVMPDATAEPAPVGPVIPEQDVVGQDAEGQDAVGQDAVGQDAVEPTVVEHATTEPTVVHEHTPAEVPRAAAARPGPPPDPRPDAVPRREVTRHGGPGVEPGGDDELDAVAAGPSPTHPHGPTGAPEPIPAPAPVPHDLQNHEPQNHEPQNHEPVPHDPHPGHHPVPVPPPAATVHPVAPASAQPARWGRVDADGTVYVRTPDGERSVGCWQAGEPEEGLAHYARRFDDVLTEVELLGARLEAGGGDPRQALTSARALRESLGQAHVVGDVAGLSGLLDSIIVRAEQAVGAQRAERDAARSAAVTRKEALAAEAEALSVEATQWKQAGDRFKAILDEWRAVRGVDKKTDELLWKRFSKAREAFNRRRGSHFAELDRQRAGARARKEELALEAEKLADSDEWGPTAARFRDLMAEWKAAGRAQKDADDALWQRFRTAQDSFFARRAQTFSERDAEFDANAAAKRSLLDEAEKIDVSDPDGARAALRAVQERWEAIGKVPRDDIRPLEARMRAVEEKVREAVDRKWRRTDPEAEARVAQFRERVAQYEAQAAKALANGDGKRAAQAQTQAEQWREWLATAEQAVQQR